MRIHKDVDTECVEWSGSKDGCGYGMITLGNKTFRLHRLIWQIYVGPIPHGMYVCHRCDNPGCLNLEHLFMGTSSENALDRETKRRGSQSRKTHCKNGHEFNVTNTYYQKQSGRGSMARICRACAIGRSKDRRSAKRDEVQAKGPG